jgi:hypothetical protein
MVKKKHPQLLFLMETKVFTGRLQKLKFGFGFDGLITVDPVGRSGGLALLWKETHFVELKNFSRRHISVTIRLLGSGELWNFTGFYGHPDRTQREESWRLLSFLKRNFQKPWLVMGGLQRDCG